MRVRVSVHSLWKQSKREKWSDEYHKEQLIKHGFIVTKEERHKQEQERKANKDG